MEFVKTVFKILILGFIVLVQIVFDVFEKPSDDKG